MDFYSLAFNSQLWSGQLRHRIHKDWKVFSEFIHGDYVEVYAWVTVLMNLMIIFSDCHQDFTLLTLVL